MKKTKRCQEDNDHPPVPEHSSIFISELHNIFCNKKKHLVLLCHNSCCKSRNISIKETKQGDCRTEIIFRLSTRGLYFESFQLRRNWKPKSYIRKDKGLNVARSAKKCTKITYSFPILNCLSFLPIRKLAFPFLEKILEITTEYNLFSSNV